VEPQRPRSDWELHFYSVPGRGRSAASCVTERAGVPKQGRLGRQHRRRVRCAPKVTELCALPSRSWPQSAWDGEQLGPTLITVGSPSRYPSGGCTPRRRTRPGSNGQPPSPASDRPLRARPIEGGQTYSVARATTDRQRLPGVRLVLSGALQAPTRPIDGPTACARVECDRARRTCCGR